MQAFKLPFGDLLGGIKKSKKVLEESHKSQTADKVSMKQSQILTRNVKKVKVMPQKSQKS